MTGSRAVVRVSFPNHHPSIRWCTWSLPTMYWSPTVTWKRKTPISLGCTTPFASTVGSPSNRLPVAR